MHDDMDERDGDAGLDFGALPRERRPGPDLERRLVDALRGQGLVRRSAPSRRMRTAASVALLAAGLAAGIALDRWSVRDPEPATYALMLYDTHEPEPGSGEISRADEYTAWARGTAAVVGGEELRAPGQWLGAAPPSEDPTLVGYFLIRAADDDEARSIALDCPHLAYGSIDLRRIERRRGG